MPQQGPTTVPQTRRRRRQHRRNLRRATVGAGLCACLVAAIAVVLAMLPVRDPESPRAQAEATHHSNEVHPELTGAAATVPHPVYRYSVIPGGAHDRQELVDAIARDQVVADHYRTVSIERVRVERLTEERRAYVSYRVGDRVFWTKHRVTLPAGEPILTDGTNQIRARCGNCIAYEPQLPTSDAEPEVLEFEALAPPGDETAPLLTAVGGSVPSAVTPLGRPAAPDLTPSLPLAVGQSGSRPFLNETGLATGLPGQSRRPAVVSRTPVSEPVPYGYEPGDAIPGESIPSASILDGSITDGHTPGAPGAPGDRILYPPLPGTLTALPAPDAFGEDNSSGDAPIELVPVPEPSTIVLLSTGVAGALWRRVRSRRGR